jgi:ABC-2 type transport system permease protein
MMAIGLSALSVGLGARLPNLRESSPAKIAAGFGGTLTLIVSALYVLALIIPPAIPAYVMYADAQLAVFPGDRSRAEVWFVAACGLATIIAGFTVWLPLRMGMRAFVRLQA